MLISSKGRYALRLMIYIAALGDTEGKIALREVADREHISQKYLEQLVRPLMKGLPHVDGQFEQGAAAYEKRGVSVSVPTWDASKCIQCNNCA